MTAALLTFAALDLLAVAFLAWKRAATAAPAPVSRPYRMRPAHRTERILVVL